MKSHRKMTAARPPDADWYVVAVVGVLKTPTLPHPSKHRQNHPALPLPKQTHRCRRPSVRTISHTKVAQCQAKKQTVVQRPTNLLLCSLALFWSRAKECIIPFDNHHQFLLSRIIHRPAPPTVRYAFVLSPSPPCCQPGARGHPKDSLRPNLNLWTPQNISPCRCPTLPAKPAHPRSQQTPPPPVSSPTRNILKRPSKRESTTAKRAPKPQPCRSKLKNSKKGQKKHQSSPHGTCGKREAGIE